MNVSPPAAGSRRKPNVFERVRDFFLRLSLWNRLALIFLLLAPFLAFGSFKVLKPLYSTWKARNSLKIAAAALENDDPRAASLAFRTAIQTQPKDPVVWRSVGKYLDDVSPSEAVSVWSRVVELAPDDEEARFALIDSAVRSQKIETAREAFAQLPETTRGSEDYHRTAASIAIASNDPVKAVEELNLVLGINPDAEEAKWDLARIRSLDPDPVVRSAAREQLREYGDGDGMYALDGLRQLVRLALAEKDFYTANRTAEDLVASRGATAQDQILHLDTEFAVQSFTLPNSIGAILEYAQAHPEAAAEITAYLTARGLNDRLSQWFDDLPEAVYQEKSVQLARFNYAQQVGDWNALFSVLRSENSPHPFTPTLVDETETALADFRRGDSEALAEWKKAIFTAENNPGATYVMATLAQSVGWREAYSLALWSLASSVSGRPEIWREVLKLELADGSSSGILRALSGAIRADPDDRQLRNDWVLMNLLLQQGDLRELLDLARGNAEHDPTNAFFATTYGLALALNDQPDEAIGAIDSLTTEQRNQPDKALYVGSILAMAGRVDEAKKFLELSDGASDNFLPEERAMRDNAEAIISGQVPRDVQIKQLTQRHEMSDEEKSDFAATLRAQIESQDDGMTSEEVTESLRRATTERQSPEEVQELLNQVRAEQETEANSAESSGEE